MTGRCRGWLVAIALTALLGTASGCRTPPTEGMVVYHDPAPRGTMNRGKLASQTLIFAIGDPAAASSAVEVKTGAIGWRSGGPGDATPSLGTGGAEIGRMKQKGFKVSSETPIYFVTPEELADVLESLDDAGLFDVPEHSGATPPNNGEPFFLIDVDSEQRRIIPKPDPTRLLRAGFSKDEGDEIAHAWFDSVRLVFYLGGYLGNR